MKLYNMKELRNSDLGLLLLRIAFGFFMIFGHGWGKMIKLFTERPIKFGDPWGMGPELSLVLAVLAEVLCALLVMVGLYTRWALIPLIITMLTAFFIVHFDDPFNRQEKALLYLFAYLGLFFAGPGKYSLDAIWRKDAF